MLLGVKEDFAIECVREPGYPNDRGRVFGRMCAWARGVALGDLSEPACLLNVTEGFIQDCLGHLDELRDEAVDGLPDEAAFRFLDAAIYLDDDRTFQQVCEDSRRYRKFDFLTSWGESFDGIRAFLLKSGDRFRILYRSPCGAVGGVKVTHDGLVEAMLAFLEWIAAEKRAVPTD